MVGLGGGVWRSSRSSVSGGPSPCHVPALPWTGRVCGSGPLSTYPGRWNNLLRYKTQQLDSDRKSREVFKFLLTNEVCIERQEKL